MCIFSAEITAVHDTRIFARIDGDEHRVLVGLAEMDHLAGPADVLIGELPARQVLLGLKTERREEAGRPRPLVLRSVALTDLEVDEGVAELPRKPHSQLGSRHQGDERPGEVELAAEQEYDVEVTRFEAFEE